MTYRPRPVVAAAIYNPTATTPTILAAQRAYPAELKGKWELPGGKIEPNETSETAVKREIFEELHAEITLQRPLPCPTSTDSAWPILGGRVMFVWLATANTSPQAGEGHLETRWVTAKQARELDWLTSNIPIVEAAFEALNSH